MLIKVLKKGTFKESIHLTSWPNVVFCFVLPGVKTTCQKERATSLLQPVISVRLSLQIVRPMRQLSSKVMCDSNGGYSPVQCHRGTPFCWCSDKYGREIPRTRISGKPECGPTGNSQSCLKIMCNQKCILATAEYIRYLIISRALVGYEMVNSQRGA